MAAEIAAVKRLRRRNERVLENLAVAARAAHVLGRRHPELLERIGGFDDAFQEAALDLVGRADAYDGRRKVKFVTYAYNNVYLRVRQKAMESGLIRVSHGSLRPEVSPEVRGEARRALGTVTRPFRATDLDDEDWEPAGREEDRWEHENVRLAVSRLHQPYRRAVELYYWEGLTLKEAGRRMGVSAERVRQYVQRAGERLRVLLGRIK